MELQLKNIGMIKEANVKIDGLTVIAGENDTGKSTVGKALYLQLESISGLDSKVDLIDKIFHSNITEKGSINLEKNKFFWKNYFIEHDFDGVLKTNNNKKHLLSPVPKPIMIETPIIFNFMELFNQLPRLERKYSIEIEVPYLMRNLDYCLNLKQRTETVLLNQKISSLIKGRFEKDARGNFFFNKNDKRIELINTATGIKMFGIFQILSEMNYLNSRTVLILDEPEVHLHPKWQLEMAKIIVDLVKNGVKVVVNSHSPYMIEALQRYGEKEKITADFYLAEDGYIDKINDSNAETLSKIFEKLSEPFDVFEEMDSQSMERLING